MITTLIAALTLPSAPQTFTAHDGKFWFDQKPYVVLSGDMHYVRVPRAYWADRFEKAKALGLNTICTYVFWNLHEPTPGKFDFSGNLDLAAYLQAAKDAGLNIILRPGPYICTEWDFGGFPAWLLKDPTVKVRSQDPRYLAAVERYLMKVGKVIQPYLLKNGGPIISAQVENEYGSYGSDHVYMAWVRDTMKKAGFDCLLTTSDGPGEGMLNGGTLPDLAPTINFGGGAEGAFKTLEKFRPGSARMIGEYWCGWFDQWGRKHNTVDAKNYLGDLEWCLKNDVSFNLYMFHGGTNFGFMQGSNGGANDFQVDTTSYDYDSPLDESGRVTPKYLAFRELLAKYSPKPLPPIPSTPDPITVPRFDLRQTASLFAVPATVTTSEQPSHFEALNQSYGLVKYSIDTTVGGKQVLDFARVYDYATVYVNGKRQGVIERRLHQKSLPITLPENGGRIDVLVESLSRVNFGGWLPNERKGLLGPVTLGTTELKGWTQTRYPLNLPVRSTRMMVTPDSPKFYEGSFTIEKPGDTFLDLRGWNKGFVWVNGKNLGRFWKIGPQQTLYLPAPFLKKGKNSVVVFDEEPTVAKPSIEGLDHPILDEVHAAQVGLHRKAGESVQLDAATLITSGNLQNGTATQDVTFPKAVTGRYVTLEATSAQNGLAFAALAELWALDTSGKQLAREKWKVIYADSEEIDSENGTADNVLDLQPTTFWHTEWGSNEPPFPHQIVIDLGETVTLTGLRLQPRQDAPNGRIKGYRIYVSSKTPVKS